MADDNHVQLIFVSSDDQPCMSIHPSLLHVGKALASVLVCFSFDLVGIVAEYAREARLVRSFGRGRLVQPDSLAVTSQGIVLVCDVNGVHRFAQDGTFLDSLADGECVVSVACDAQDRVYALVPEQGIRIYDTRGSRLGLIPVNHCRSIDSLCEHAGELFFVDHTLQSIRVVRSDGSQRRSIKGGGLNPRRCIVDRNGLVHVNNMNNTWLVLPKNGGSPIRKLDGQTLHQAYIAHGFGMASDPQGRVWILSQHLDKQVFQVYEPDGSGPCPLDVTFPGDPLPQLLEHQGICIDAQGNIYAFGQNKTVLVFAV